MRVPLRIIRAVFLAAPLLLGSVQAQVVVPAPSSDYPVSPAAEVIAVSAEMDILLAELEHIHAYSLGDGMSIGMLHDCDCCYAPGWSAGVELPMLKPHFGGGIFVEQPGFVQRSPGYGYHASPRFHLAYRSLLGLGIRGRYWRFDRNADSLVFEDIGVAETFGSSLDLQAVDLEVTKVFYLSGVHWDLGAGARYARVNFTREYGLAFADFPDFNRIVLKQLDFEGVGPTFSTEGRYRIGMSRLSVIGNLRASMLVGDQRVDHVERLSGLEPPIDFAVTGRFTDKIVPVLESQIGLEWARPLRRGRLFARAMVEGQWWGNVVTPAFDAALPLFPLEGAGFEQSRAAQLQEDLGFVGATFSVTYVW